MAILKYANQSGVVYAYESISEWDPEKKQSRSKRKCLGRVDPDTGDIIPTSGKRGRPPKADTGKSQNDGAAYDPPAAEEKLRKLKKDYGELKKQNEILLDENRKLKSVISRIGNEISCIQ